MSNSLRRHAVGILALMLLLAAAVLLVRFDENLAKGAGSVCLRLGLTLGALWLALPQIVTLTARCPPRLLITLLVGSMIVVVRPRSFPLVAALVGVMALIELAGWLMRPLPPNKKRPGQGPGETDDRP